VTQLNVLNFKKKLFVNPLNTTKPSPKMKRFAKCGCVVLAVLLMSLNVKTNAQPLTTNGNDSQTQLPPLIFPKQNVTIGNGLPPAIFPKEDATVVDKMPLYTDLPPLIFPDDNKTFTVIPPTNQTALKILNSKASEKPFSFENTTLDSEYYDDPIENSDTSEEVDDVDDVGDVGDVQDVEDVQAVDKNPQTDGLEENYKSEVNASPNLPINDFDDNTEVDHPMLQNAHIFGIFGAVLAVLCVCFYLGITIWRRRNFNRYAMRERLINEDDFYSNKSIHHNF